MMTKIFIPITCVVAISLATLSQIHAYQLIYENGRYSAMCDNGYAFTVGDNQPVEHSTARVICAKQGSSLATNPKGGATPKAMAPAQRLKNRK